MKQKRKSWLGEKRNWFKEKEEIENNESVGVVLDTN